MVDENENIPKPLKNQNNSKSQNNQPYNWKHKMIDSLFQLVVNLLAGVFVAVFAGWQAVNNVPPKPKAEVTPVSASSAKITVENSGLISAFGESKVATSTPSGFEDFKIESGKPFIKIEATDSEKVKRVIVDGLPKSEVIQINIVGEDIEIIESKNIKINSK